MKCLQDYHVMSLLHEKERCVSAEREKALLDCYPDGKKVVYLGDVGTYENEVVIEYGSTDRSRKRTADNKRDYGRFDLLYFM